MFFFDMRILFVLLILTIVVLVHEIGHYVVARALGCRVSKIHIFFGKIFSIKPNPRPDGRPSWRDTEYAIGWLPLGGVTVYEDQPLPYEHVDEQGNKIMVTPPGRSWYYSNKPAWARLLIAIAGVSFNLLTAVAILAAIVFTTDYEITPYVANRDGMYFSSLAQLAGFRNGDIPLRADNRPLHYLTDDEINEMLDAKTVTVLRNHTDTLDIAIPASLKSVYKSSRHDPNAYFMVYQSKAGSQQPVVHVTITASQSARLITDMVINQVKGVVYSMAGAMGLKARYTIPFSHDSYRVCVLSSMHAHPFLTTLASFSIGLFVLNLIPIYPLDGGAAAFCIYEMVAHRRPSRRFQNIVGMIGTIVIIIIFWILPLIV